MTTLYTGYTESPAQTDARAWRIACQSQGYTYRHNVTEAEADELHKLVEICETDPEHIRTAKPAQLNASATNAFTACDWDMTPDENMPEIDMDKINEVEF